LGQKIDKFLGSGEDVERFRDMIMYILFLLAKTCIWFWCWDSPLWCERHLTSFVWPFSFSSFRIYTGNETTNGTRVCFNWAVFDKAWSCRWPDGQL